MQLSEDASGGNVRSTSRIPSGRFNVRGSVAGAVDADHLLLVVVLVAVIVVVIAVIVA